MSSQEAPRIRSFSSSARILVLSTVLLAGSPDRAAAVSESVTPWLLFSMGARASGMGGAQITEAIGADRLYWNPALLGFQRGISETAMYFAPVPDLTDDVMFWYASAAGGWDGIGGFGLNYMYLSYGESQATDASGISLGTFSSWERSVGAGYGAAFTENFTGGVGLKYIHSELSPEFQDLQEGKGSTWAVDFGVHARRIFADSFGGGVLANGFRWGLSIQNMGPALEFVDNGSPNPLPLNFRMGIGFDGYVDEHQRITFAADMNKVLVRQSGGTGTEDFEVDPAWKALFTAWTDESFREELEDAIYNLGFEYGLEEMAFFRAGWYHDETGDITDYTLGVGAQYEYEWVGVRFDYASFPQATGLDRVHRVSGMVSMGENSRIGAPLRAGFKTGLNLSKVRSGPSGESSDSRFGLALGGYVALAINEILSLQHELLFMTKGSDTALELSYVEIPVLAKATLGAEDSVRPLFFAGPSLGFNVAASSFDESFASAFEREVLEFEFCGVVGGGLEFPLSSRDQTVGLEVRFSQGFTDLGLGGDLRNQVFSFMGTFGFR